jgi:hypothetical protein
MRKPAVIVVLAALAILVAALLAVVVYPAWLHHRAAERKILCQARLADLGKALSLYRQRYGGGRWYPAPAPAFRGTDWIATLYWTRLVGAEALHCPGCEARRIAPIDRSGDNRFEGHGLRLWDGSLTQDAVGYAGRARGPDVDGRPTPTFTEDELRADLPAIADLAGNHDGGIHVLFFDQHVAWMPDAGPYVGAGTRTGTELERLLVYLDHPDADNHPPLDAPPEPTTEPAGTTTPTTGTTEWETTDG